MPNLDLTYEAAEMSTEHAVANTAPALSTPQALSRWRLFSLLLGLYALALAIRVVCGLFIGMGSPPSHDEPDFYLLAVSLAEGEGYSKVGQQSPDGVSRPTAYRMPGPSMVTAFAFTLFGNGVEVARWTAAVVGAFSAPL